LLNRDLLLILINIIYNSPVQTFGLLNPDLLLNRESFNRILFT